MYAMHKVFRLCRRQILVQNNRFHNARVTNGFENDIKQDKHKDFDSLLQTYKEKITFNSYLEHEKLKLGYFKYYLKTLKRARKEEEMQYRDKSLPQLPVALQYYLDKDRLLQENSIETPEPEKQFQAPLAKSTQIKYDKNQNEEVDVYREEKSQYDRSDINSWMTNYEHFDDTQLDSECEEWQKYYGTADPTANVSSVPCGGCGALLHCSDTAIPGYLPSEIFKGRLDDELKTLECQRCHFLKEYNIALDVTVQPEEYEKLLQSIRHVKSLVILMVDLLDFPCSIWPGIVDIIGTERPIIIVGNKVDLLPGDSFGYLKRIKNSLLSEINKTKLGEANIKHVALISAKTGYGVEDLISTMFKQWLYKGDVFLVGCTNVGKSSLFNALLQSDYCKVHAVDIVKRATVSRWPGTTLNLLKFPINRPSGWKIYARTKRLQSEAKLLQVEKEIRNAQLVDQPPTEAPALIGHIGRSFGMVLDSPDASNSTVMEKKTLTVLDERNEIFQKSKWFYDTPGVVHPDQVLSLLSTEELLITIPKKLIRPQTYYLYEGSTIFIGGLGRIDLKSSPLPCRLTVFCSESLPLTVTKTEDADEIYNKFVCTELFGVPFGGQKRLEGWPGLHKSDQVHEFVGEGPKVCCGDIVLSSIGWVSFTVKGGTKCLVEVWTPEGRGIHKRYPSMLPYAINLKGKRIRDTPAYVIGRIFSEDV